MVKCAYMLNIYKHQVFFYYEAESSFVKLKSLNNAVTGVVRMLNIKMFYQFLLLTVWRSGAMLQWLKVWQESSCI